MLLLDVRGQLTVCKLSTKVRVSSFGALVLIEAGVVSGLFSFLFVLLLVLAPVPVPAHPK